MAGGRQGRVRPDKMGELEHRRCLQLGCPGLGQGVPEPSSLAVTKQGLTFCSEDRDLDTG